jgi:hypothetical protein
MCRIPRIILASLLILLVQQFSYSQSKIENIIIVTTDGLRWQEVFEGMDSSIANNASFHRGDSSEIFEKFWAAATAERRGKLMPFFWSTLERNGQLYGNRNFDNKVDIANPYWFSYPGYNEILTGYPDQKINTNKYMNNPNTTILDFLQQQPSFHNRIAAFTSWIAFNRILNKPRAGFPIVAAHDTLAEPKLTSTQLLLHEMKRTSSIPLDNSHCNDIITYFQAIEYLKSRKPKVLYLAFSETDVYSHSGDYLSYLNAALQLDKSIENLWNNIQSMPEYKNKTALFVTTDHGRGNKIKTQWTDHDSTITDSHEIWFAVMGPNIPAKGEITAPAQFYQKQFAQTIAFLLGLTFVAEHPVGDKIPGIFK